MNKLIRTIELLNEKSVVFGIDNSRSNLWILMHLKDLRITSKKIYYQITKLLVISLMQQKHESAFVVCS